MSTSAEYAEILAAVAGTGGKATNRQLRADLGHRPDPAALSRLRLRGSLTGGGEARTAERTPYRITHRGRWHLARLTNLAARFDPADLASAGPQPEDSHELPTYPSITTGGAQAFLYVDVSGALRLALHLDTGEVPAWLTRADHTIPVSVTINGETVFDDTQPDRAAAGRREGASAAWPHPTRAKS